MLLTLEGSIGGLGGNKPGILEYINLLSVKYNVTI